MSETQLESNDIISVRDIVSFFWRVKFLFSSIVGIFALASVFWVMQLEDQYTAEALLVPSEMQGKVSSLGGDIGGLASLAGLDLGSGSSSKPTVALELIKSKAFIVDFIDKYQLLPLLLAVESWDSQTQMLSFNPEVYNPETKQWLRDPPPGKDVQPRPWEGIAPFQKALQVTEENSPVVTTITFTHLSPYVAAEIIENLIKEMNYVMRQDAIREAEGNIRYLEENVETTKYQEVRSAMFSLVEEQIKNLMLAKVRDEYVFKTVSKPIVPEEKSGPSRALICIVVTFIGAVVALFVSIFVDAFRTPART